MTNFTYYSDLEGVQLAEVGGKTVSWLKIMGVGTYKHPFHGELKYDATRIKRFSDNQKRRVRGIDLDVDYDHKTDSAKGNQAAGWIKDTEARSDGLYAFVEWTPTAVTEIKEGKWRYISPDYADEWENPQGVKFNDVLCGAGLTNRPFLKDLLPINLSELSFTLDAPKKNEPNPKGAEVDPKQLRERLGLSADATDADVETRCALLKQLSEAFPQGAPTPPTPPIPPAPPVVAPVIEVPESLKQLAEKNPALQSLIDYTEQTMRLNVENQKKLREAEVNRKLSEFDASKITLTPKARTLVGEIMLHEKMPADLANKIWDMMDEMKSGHSFFVELGERAGVNVKYGRVGEQSATDQFVKLQESLVGKGMKLADAYDKIAKENPQLFEQYREEATAFHA